MAGTDKKLVSTDAPGPIPDPPAVGPAPTNLSSAFGNYALGNPGSATPAAPATGTMAPPAAPAAPSADAGAQLPLTPNFAPDLPSNAYDSTNVTSGGGRIRPEDRERVAAAGKDYGSALHREAGVVEESTGKQAEVMRDTAVKIGAANEELTRLHAADAEHRAQLQAKSDALRQDYLDAVRDKSLGTALNPTTGQKVASIFALLLSGAGAGVTHSPNAAMAMLEQEYNRAWAARKDRLDRKKGAVDDTDRLIMRNEQLYQNRDQAKLADIMAMRQLGADRVAELAKYYQGPEAQAKADEVINLTQLKNAQDMAQIQALHTSSTTHVASAAEKLEAQQKLTMGNAQMYALIQNGGIKPEAIAKIGEELDKRGITSTNTAFQEAYRNSNGLKDIPGPMVRAFASLGSNVKPGASPSEVLTNWGNTLLSNMGATDKEKKFVAATQIMVRSLAKRMEGGRISDQDGAAYNSASGLGPNASPEQVRDVLMQIRNANIAAEMSVFAEHGGAQAREIWRQTMRGLGAPSGLAQDQNLEGSTTDKPIPGLAPRGR